MPDQQKLFRWLVTDHHGNFYEVVSTEPSWSDGIVGFTDKMGPDGDAPLLALFTGNFAVRRGNEIQR